MRSKILSKKAIGMLLSAVMLTSACIGFNSYAVTAEESAAAPAAETVTITESSGWHESAYVKWSPYTGAEGYNVYVKPAGGEYTKLDDMLVREYKTYCRADALGLSAGEYTMKVVPVVSGKEDASLASETTALTVDNYVREGFAFSDQSPAKYTTGAYNQDGTLKADAIVLYVTDANRDSVTIKGQETLGEGLNAIMSKAKNLSVPLDVRLIGKVRRPANINLDSTLRVQDVKNVTIEGVGDDATLYGWGITLKRTNNIEIRNAAIMWHCNGTDGDAISMDTENFNIFVHNMDFYYGAPGAEEDQKKGDGTVDMKQMTDYVTISYNHFYDTGKSTFSGGQWELNNKTDPRAKVNVTYHHNWFDHSDSRHPRCVVGNTHVYNNYYAGNGYGAAACENASVFVESNYFENCEMPMMIGSQGSDSYRGKGSYSGSKNLSNQDGGMIKEYGNYMTGQGTFFNQNNCEVSGQIDAYSVTDPKAKVPESIQALKGGWAYNNFDTADTMYSYTPDTPEQAKANVISGAGRMNGGDLKWEFTSADNKNGAVIEGLKNAIANYSTELVKAGGVSVEGAEPEMPTEGTTEAVEDGGALKDDKVWDISKLSTDTVDGIRFGEAGAYHTGKNTYISEDKHSYEIDGYYTGSENPKTADNANPSGTAVPVTGSFLCVTAPDDGVITTAMRTGNDKISYVSDGANIIKEINNKNNPNYSFDVVSFDAKKGVDYYIYTDGSKIRIAYLGFTAGGQGGTEPEPAEPDWGDADGNDTVDVNDVQFTLDYVLTGNTTGITEETASGLDVNNDGKVDSEDVAMILQKVLDSSYTIK